MYECMHVCMGSYVCMKLCTYAWVAIICDSATETLQAAHQFERLSHTVHDKLGHSHRQVLRIH